MTDAEKKAKKKAKKAAQKVLDEKKGASPGFPHHFFSDLWVWLNSHSTCIQRQGTRSNTTQR